MTTYADAAFELTSLDYRDNDNLIRASRTWSEPTRVVLSIAADAKAYPNHVVPLAATLDFLRAQGHQFVLSDDSDLGIRRRAAGIATLLQPVSASELGFVSTDLVIRYDSESEAQAISSRFMDALTEAVICESGVIDALNWCVYEVLDNVFQHSTAPSGYVMMQLHARSRKLAIAVSDTGRGIHKSMVDAVDASKIDRTKLAHAHLAIEHALQQGVTSKGSLNQGNGLHGLRRSVEINGGSLAVRSGRGLWSYARANVRMNTDLSRPVLNAETAHATTVDWQLDCATPVSINDALGRPERSSELLEQIEVAPEHYRIDARDIEEYVGSRAKGSEIRTRIRNYLNSGAKQVVIDLANIGVVSSSFADEVAGKLAAELGELEYRRRVFIDGASPTNRGLIERAIELRLSSGSAPN